MGGRGSSSAVSGGVNKILNSISSEHGVKNYKKDQTFLKAKPDGSYELQKGATFSMNGRTYGVHVVTGLSAGKFMVTDINTGMGVGLSHTIKDAVSVARKSTKKIKADPRLPELENKLNSYKRKKR